MKTLARICCLIFAASLLTVLLSAEEYKEDFILPGSSYYTLTNLQKCSKDIGRLFSIGVVPDASGFSLQDCTATGSAVFKVSGAQSVRVGYYTTYGPYIERSPADGMYRLCNMAPGGKSSTPFFEDSSRSLCFQDTGKILYLSWQSSGDFIFTELGKDIAPENPQLKNAYLNVYSSEDGSAFRQVGTEIVLCLFGEQLKTELNNVYCEATAQIPKGSRYVKLEINQPSRMVLDGSQWTTIKPIVGTLLANVNFIGEKLIMGGANDSSGEAPPALPQTGSSLSNTQGNDVFSQNSGAEAYGTAATGQVIMAVGRQEYSNKTALAGQGSDEEKSEQVGSTTTINKTPSVAYHQTLSNDGVYEAKINNSNRLLESSAAQDYSKILIAISGFITILIVTYTVNKLALRVQKQRPSIEPLQKEEVSAEISVKTNGPARETSIPADEDVLSAESSAACSFPPSSTSTPTDEDALSAEYWLF